MRHSYFGHGADCQRRGVRAKGGRRAAVWRARRAPAAHFRVGRISFVAPPGFTALTAEELTVKYPRGGAPRQAVSNARGTTSIAYDLQDLRAPSNDLEALRKELLQGFAQMPKLK